MNTKEKFDRIIDSELQNIPEALAALKKDDPYKYMTIMARLLSFCWPERLDVQTCDFPMPDLSECSFDDLFMLKHGYKPGGDEEVKESKESTL